ncbi:MAG: 50S ribosomal protein L10 [Balneolaceae bacterium]
MPTTLAEKKAVVEEITENLNSSDALYITDYKGLSVAEINELRSKFRQGKVHFKVYKNTLIKRAMEEVGGFDELYPHLNNQNGFAFVSEELAAPAKILKEFNREHQKPKFVAALVDGDYYSEAKLDSLASMKSKNEILGDILGLLMSPVKNVISGLQSQGKTIAGAVQTIAEKNEE